MSDEAVWVFDGADGRADVLAALVLKQLSALEELVVDSSDPLERMRLEEELADHPVTQRVEISRLFPDASADPEEANAFRQHSLSPQAQKRVEAARQVMTDLSLDEHAPDTPVNRGAVTAWVTTLAGLRASWHAQLVRSNDRMAVASQEDADANPQAAAICDWLGYLLEDLLDSAAA